jgi:hypothetical protein
MQQGGVRRLVTDAGLSTSTKSGRAAGGSGMANGVELVGPRVAADESHEARMGSSLWKMGSRM